MDGLAAAYASGGYPAGAQLLDELSANPKGGKLATYAAFKLIEAEFTLQNADQGNFVAGPGSLARQAQGLRREVPSKRRGALRLSCFLASTNEMNGRESDAKPYYARLAEQSSPATEWGKKAAGALRRLDLVGKPIGHQGGRPPGPVGGCLAVSG